MTTATGWISIELPEVHDCAHCDVLAETDVALHLKNRENGHDVWIPKSGLQREGDFTYSIKPWFRHAADARQKQVIEGWI